MEPWHWDPSIPISIENREIKVTSPKVSGVPSELEQVLYPDLIKPKSWRLGSRSKNCFPTRFPLERTRTPDRERRKMSITKKSRRRQRDPTPGTPGPKRKPRLAKSSCCGFHGWLFVQLGQELSGIENLRIILGKTRKNSSEPSMYTSC